MKNFEIIRLDNQNFNILVIMKTNEPPLFEDNQICEELKNFDKGKILMDQMLHSGNSKERFISCFFDGESLSDFQFETITKGDPLREHMCAYLRSDPELLKYSVLTTRQQRLIAHGCTI